MHVLFNNNDSILFDEVIFLLNLISVVLYEQKEFEEARKELQTELEKGISIEAIRKKITKGEIKTNVSKIPDTKRYNAVGRIQRKKRDLMQLLNKYTPGTIKETIPAKPPTLSSMDLFAKAKEEQSGGPALRKNVYKLANKELLVRYYCFHVPSEDI